MGVLWRRRAYKSYITALVSYLTSFFHRTQPLTDAAGLMSKVGGGGKKKDVCSIGSYVT